MVKRHQVVTADRRTPATRMQAKKGSETSSSARGGGGGGRRGAAEREMGRRDANPTHTGARAGGRRGGKQKGSDDDDEDGHHYSAIAEFIPPDLDEDIDDDLAFNSDDEELYGAYFQQSSAKRSTKKEPKMKAKKTSIDAEDDPLDRLEALGKAKKVAARKGATDAKDTDYSSSDDDNGDRSDSDGEYMDLSDMLDSTPSVTVKKQSGATAKKSSITPTPAVVPASQAAKKASRKASIVEEPESLLGPFSEVDAGSSASTKKKKGSSAHNYTNALETLLVKPASQRQKADNADAEADEALHSVRARLEHAFSSRGTLLSTDMDEYEKEKLTRKHERELVEEEMGKYNAFLKEQREAKHIAFPMRPPESNPVPTSIGSLLAAARDRQQRSSAAAEPGADESTTARTAMSLLPQNLFQSFGNRSIESIAAASQVKAAGARRGEAAQRLISNTQAMLAAAGLSAEAIDQEAKTGAVMETLLKEHGSPSHGKKSKSADTASSERPVSFGEHVSFVKEGDGDGVNGGDGSEMTHSYMAKLKAMLAYEVNKRRRFNKIKSKTYRRLLRKEKEKEKKQREEVFSLLHPQQARERLAKKLEMDRARERLTQKHKNTSKWVQHIKRNKHLLMAGGDGPNSESLQDALDEQHLLHQMLMQKMDESAGDLQKSMLYHERNEDDDDGESTDSDDEIVDELIGRANTAAGITSSASERRKAVESLLWKVIDEDDRDGADARAEKLRNATPVERARAELKSMDFMKNANARKREEMREQVEALADDVERYRQGDDDEGTVDDERDREQLKEEKGKKKASKGLPGGAAAGRVSFKEKDVGTNDKKGAKSKGVATKEREVKFKQRSGISLQDSSSAVNGDNDAQDAQNEIPFASDEDVEETEVPLSGGLPVKKAAQADGKSATTHPNKASSGLSGFAGDRASSTKTSTRVAMLASGIKRMRDAPEESSLLKATVAARKASTPAALAASEPNLEEQQTYLISRAFASDDVDEDFLAQKRGYVEQVMKPRDANETLPGWGEWGGDSEENPQLNQRHRERVSRIELERNIARQQLMRSRADAKLDNVIINHDGVELVPDRMTLHMVPRPFSNATEFTRSMRQPMGPEWTSSVLFKDANQPRVTVNQGQAVMPLDISMRRKTSEAKTSRRKVNAAKKTKGKQ